MRGERGQILVLVLMLMTLGTLVITPLLAYVNLSLRLNSRAEVRSQAYYAAEAGVDAVISDLFHGENLLSTAYPPESSLLERNGDNLFLKQAVNGYPVNITIAPPLNPPPLTTTTYDFSNPTPGSKAWYVDSDNRPPEDNPNEVIELTAGEYANISASDDQRYTSPDPDGWWWDDYASIKCEIALGEAIVPRSVTQIKIEWEGYPSWSYDVSLWVWNINTNNWDEKARVDCPDSDTTINTTISTDITNYIGCDRHIIFCVQNRDGDECLTTDYIRVEIIHKPPELYLDPGVVFWLQDIEPGGNASCSYEFAMLAGNATINWVLFPDGPASNFTWTLSLEKDGILVDPPGIVSGTGSPAILEAIDPGTGNYIANFWVQNSEDAYTSLYTMPYMSSGCSGYTWLELTRGYQEYIITSNAGDITITCYVRQTPGSSGWWKKQAVEMLSWQIE